MEIRNKEVDFHEYCAKCKYRFREETEDPCNDCLDHPVNQNSKKPILYIPSKKWR